MRGETIGEARDRLTQELEILEKTGCLLVRLWARAELKGLKGTEEKQQYDLEKFLRKLWAR